MELGTYSTIDCPTQNIEEAYEWLQGKFEEIGGYVRKVMNPHDFGKYPSFEIDYPKELDEHGGDDCVVCEVGEECPLDEWHDKANIIEAKYNEKFSDYL